MPVRITSTITVPDAELDFSFVRSSGAGGQNVNKVASAVELRFRIPASSLPDPVKSRLLASSDRRISRDGILRIKAQRYRTQESNRRDAIRRFTALLAKYAEPRRRRRKSAVPLAEKRKRLDRKSRRSAVKQSRAKPPLDG